MATKKKLLQAAAGAGGGAAALNVEDVFSTYLYEGTGGSQSIENGIALGDFGLGTSTKFDGTNDYLSRSSDLTGNADGKTFTFSAWIYHQKTGSNQEIYHAYDGSNRVIIRTNDAGDIIVFGEGGSVLNWTASGALTTNVWNHFIVSLDLSNTSNRHFYINDVVSPNSPTTYSNSNINFTTSSHYIGKFATASNYVKGRLAHVYLDYTYRDLSVEANRRLFIDANGGSTAPSTLSALSPILYLPMTEDYSIGENIGTGGDFTVNGSPTIIQSGTEYEDGYGEGGMVWIKSRSWTYPHNLYDTERGATKRLKSSSTNAESTLSTGLTAFSSTGFTLGGDNDTNGTYSDAKYTSWTFRKAPKFFDVVTYTGDGTSSGDLQTISHSLGSTPGMIITKSTSNTSDWLVHHRSLSSELLNLKLNATDAQAVIGDWNPTSTTFTVEHQTYASNAGNNENNRTYVAYLFAHNDGDGEFGPDGDADIIKCGSYTGTGSDFEISLGWEPQFIIVKKASGTSNWFVWDTMRGIVTGGNDPRLDLNTSNAENTSADWMTVSATGFTPWAAALGDSGETYIYIAIRRGPMAVPESATDVFAIDTGNSTKPWFQSGFPVDMGFYRDVTSTADWAISSRLTGNGRLDTNTTDAEVTNSLADFDFMNGWYDLGTAASTNYSWMWKRAPNYFDVVAYTGTGALTDRNHNLGVKPEMIWIKSRSGAYPWYVFYNFTSTTLERLVLNTTAAANTSLSYSSGYGIQEEPTDTKFVSSPYDNDNWNGVNQNYIAYLFASLDGVSKVGSYTGNGSTTGPSIDCGFSAGPRFVLIKRTDSAENWYMFDSERGIVAGADPYLMLNSTSAEINAGDIIDPTSSGFQLATNGSSVNASGGTYIFYAIA